MNTAKKIGLCVVLACMAVSQACAWSVRKAKKTHVRVLVVDEDRKPVSGQKISFRLRGGCGSKFTRVSGEDGMVSFLEDIGSYAVCTFDIDRNVHYPVWFEFHPEADGSIVTGVVKRVAKPVDMVRLSIKGHVSNGVDQVGLDLVYGDFVHPFGKGRHADLYLTMQTMRDESVRADCEWKKTYSRYGFARANSPSEFSIVEKDIGCALPTPVLAPETMMNNSNATFQVDYRPDKSGIEFIGDKKYVLFKVVRDNSIYYGVITGGTCCWSARNNCNGCELNYRMNVNKGDRNIVWSGWSPESDWRKQVESWYAEEDFEKEKKATVQNKEVAK